MPLTWTFYEHASAAWMRKRLWVNLLLFIRQKEHKHKKGIIARSVYGKTKEI